MKYLKERTIIFLNEKKDCERLYALFIFFGLKAAQIHGNINQSDRMKNVELFQAGEVDYLIATDVLTRGVDIYKIHAVVNM